MAITKHDGREVRQHQIKVTNTGDGLSQAVAVDPVDLHIGDKVYALIECEKRADGFAPINNGNDLKMVHTLRGGAATLIDASLAKPLVEQQTERIIKARDEAAGFSQLGDPDNGLGATKKALDKSPARPVDKTAAKKAAGAKATAGGTVTPIGSAKKAPAKKAPAKKS